MSVGAEKELSVVWKWLLGFSKTDVQQLKVSYKVYGATSRTTNQCHALDFNISPEVQKYPNYLRNFQKNEEEKKIGICVYFHPLLLWECLETFFIHQMSLSHGRGWRLLAVAHLPWHLSVFCALILGTLPCPYQPTVHASVLSSGAEGIISSCIKSLVPGSHLQLPFIDFATFPPPPTDI